MKLLYLNFDEGIPVLGGKGASVHVREFVTAAAGLGHEVVLACSRLGAGDAPPPARLLELPPDEAPEGLAAECAALGLTTDSLSDDVLRREVVRLAHDRALPQRLLRALTELRFRPDAIYERHALFHNAGAAIAARLGVPRLLEVNAPLREEQRRFRSLKLEDPARLAEAASYRDADVIIAVSAGVAAHVRSVIGAANKLHIVPNGVDAERFGAGVGGAEVRARTGVGGAPVIGFVGSFKIWHGGLFLLETFAELASVRPDVRLVAVGDGPTLEETRARAMSAGLANKVVFPGRVPHAEISGWYDAMDLTVAPYLPQPDFYFSPLKVIESLAAGRPVVAPRIGQLTDLIEDGKTGLLYAPGDKAGCLAAISRLLDDPARRCAMGDAAKRHALRLGWRQVVSRILDLPFSCGARKCA
jgi:glycosyltransferase involved in cell wall biosynthesis